MSDSNPVNPKALPQKATRAVQPLRFQANGAPPTRESDYVVVEDILVIDIEDVGNYTLLCTPHDTRALAVGFAFSEGIISRIDDINVLSHCEDTPGVIRMALVDPAREQGPERNLIVTSSCGM